MLILRLFLLSLCFSPAHSQDLQLLKATSQSWSGGAPGSPPGTYYVIQFITRKASSSTKAEGLWIGEEFFPVSFAKGRSGKDFNAKDTINISINKYARMKKEDDSPANREEKPQIKPPYSYKGAALLKYTVNKKVKYLEINTFQSLKQIIYP